MSEIKTGDRVRWVQEYHFNLTRTHTCTVGSVFGSLAVITTDGGATVMVSQCELTPLTDTAIVAAVAAMPQDDADREDVLAQLRNAGAHA